MKYKIYGFFLFCFLMISVVSGQKVVLTTDKYPEIGYLGISGNIYFNENQQVKGSAFLINDWTQGDIYLNNGTIIKDVNIKIDICAHQVIVYHNLVKQVVIVDKIGINSMVLHTPEGERHFKRLNINRTRSNSVDGIFIEVLSEGIISFYKMSFKEKVFLANPVKPFIYEFIDGEEYKLNYSSQDLAVSLRKRSLYKLFPENKSELKQYIKTNKLKLKNQKDFAKAISYLNEIKK